MHNDVAAFFCFSLHFIKLQDSIRKKSSDNTTTYLKIITPGYQLSSYFYNFAFESKAMGKITSLIIILLLLVSCNKSTKEIDELFKNKTIALEKADNIKLLYSDSAKILLILESPHMRTTEKSGKKIIEYPSGIKISFLDEKGVTSSWLEADRAVNKIKDKLFIASGNVKLYNDNNDKLETSELIWDEKKEILYTKKFIKITQPHKGDTIYGYGFESNKEFTEFEIKRRMSGKIADDILKDLK